MIKFGGTAVNHPLSVVPFDLSADVTGLESVGSRAGRLHVSGAGTGDESGGEHDYMRWGEKRVAKTSARE